MQDFADKLCSDDIGNGDIVNKAKFESSYIMSTTGRNVIILGLKSLH